MSSNDRLLENRTLYHGDNLDFLRRYHPIVWTWFILIHRFRKGKDFVGKTGTLAEEAMFQDSWKWLEDVNTEWLDFYRENWPSVAGVIENSKYARDYGMAAFLSWLGLRLIECHRILKDTGSIYLHCDPTASHYLKMLMDAVFGVNNFRNEIVWCYRTGGATKTHFARKHDVILFYSKSNRWTFNQPKERSYTENLKWSKSSQVYTDEYGRYQNRLFSKTIIKVYQDDHGRFYTITGGRDYWNLDAIGRTSKERTGYPTQKPLALLELIIKASSNEGDLVADFFMGSGTTAIAAERLNRCWIGADAWSDAGATIKSRLDLEFGVLDPESKPLLQIKEINRPYVIQNDISEFNEYPITEEVFSHPVTPTKKTTNAKWKSQLVSENMLTDTNGNSLWICLGCQELFTHTRHFTVDHKIPVSKKVSGRYRKRSTTLR